MSLTSKLNNNGAVKKPVSLVLSLLVLAAVATALMQRQQLIDYIRLYNYTPPATVVTLATEDGLTASTRRVLYVNHPELEDKATFKSSCPNNGGEKTIILGCYHGGQSGIYLLSVNDPRLDGVIQVTAAHEVLHAAYDRLSSKQRADVDAMLMDYYTNQLTDQRIKDTIEGYKKSEPKDVVNEMHSIFGTEVSTLPAGLENYYKLYFSDRHKVTAYADRYQSEFTNRKNTIEQDDAKLSALKQQINSLESSLSAMQSQITSRQQELLSRRRNGDTAGYNAGVPGYNAQIDAYNARVNEVQSLVNQYNQLVSTRNSIAAEISELSNALSSGATQINK